VVVNASYCGVLPARFIGRHAPRAAIGVDCGVGPAGAAIAGLWYLEALNLPAATADVMTSRLGDGVDLFERGRISFVNRPAGDCGVVPGMSVREASLLLLEVDPGEPSAEEVDHREVMWTHASGRSVVCTDSIAFGLPEDRDRNVLVTAGHTGRSAVPYLTSVHPHGFICSDGGRGDADSGMAGMFAVDELGLAGATVDASLAAMGDGHSTYRSGVISAVNRTAEAAGVRVGMSAADAARLLVEREPRQGAD
jgi:uncharacterized protein YunC (DUF1805 family)